MPLTLRRRSRSPGRAAGDDEVVEDADVEKGERLLEALRQQLAAPRRRRGVAGEATNRIVPELDYG
jgi:hypothetical protein